MKWIKVNKIPNKNVPMTSIWQIFFYSQVTYPEFHNFLDSKNFKEASTNPE